LTGEELRSDDLNGVANPSAEGVRGDTQSGEAERPLSDMEIEAIAAAEQADAAAAAAAKVLVHPVLVCKPYGPIRYCSSSYCIAFLRNEIFAEKKSLGGKIA